MFDIDYDDYKDWLKWSLVAILLAGIAAWFFDEPREQVDNCTEITITE